MEIPLEVERIFSDSMMAAENMNMHEIEEASLIKDFDLASPSYKILPNRSGIFVNPEESVTTSVESSRLQTDSNSETPNKYPNAPHSSPVGVQSNPDSSLFAAELLRCLNKLPMKLLPAEEHTDDNCSKTSGFSAENIRSYLEIASCIESNSLKDLQDGYKSEAVGSFSTKCITDPELYRQSDLQAWDSNSVIDQNNKTETFITEPELYRKSGPQAWDSSSVIDQKNETETFQIFTSQLEKFNLLRIDNVDEFETDFYRRGTLSESMVVNSPDLSDFSLEDHDDSSCSSRDLEFEALAIDFAKNPSVDRRYQHWKPRGRSKRALSLDELNPSKLLCASEISKTMFKLII